jgi:hypothetical protein
MAETKSISHSTSGGFRSTPTTATYTPPEDENLDQLEMNHVVVTPGVVQANTGITIRWALTDSSEVIADELNAKYAEENPDWGGS